MQKSKCNKDLYKSFLQASSVRYSGKALSEVSPKNLSHDSASRWLNNSNFRPNEVYKESSQDKPPHGGSLMQSIVAGSVDKCYHERLPKIS